MYIYLPNPSVDLATYLVKALRMMMHDHVSVLTGAASPFHSCQNQFRCPSDKGGTKLSLVTGPWGLGPKGSRAPRPGLFRGDRWSEKGLRGLLVKNSSEPINSTVDT